MTTIGKVRNAIARLDNDNPNKKNGLAKSESERGTAIRNNTIDAVLEGVNAVVAGTPVSWVTGPLTIAYGGLKMAGGLTEAILGGWVGNAHNGEANLRSGLKSVVSGTTAMIPIVGNYVNGVLAVKDSVDAVNSALPAPKE